MREYILQCWAEAREKIDTPEMKPFASSALLEEYTTAQETAMQDDWRVGAISSFLEHKNPGELTCVREVCHRALSPNPDFPHEPSLIESKDIGKIMDKMKDWERVGIRKVGAYGKQNAWKKRGEQAISEESEFPFM